MRRYFLKLLSASILFFIIINSNIAFAIDTSTPVSSDSIDITNNVGKADVIHVINLTEGDIVKVYNASSGGRIIGGGVVPGFQSEVSINISQLGSASGSVFISVTSKGKLESSRTEADYSGEPKSAALDANNVVITNNVKKIDTIKISNLSDGDVVKVYNATSGGRLIGSAKLPAYQSEATINITQLGSAAGKVFISITSTGMLESDRTAVDYSAEPISTDIDPNNVTITNNAGKPDTVYLNNLQSGDIVKIYNAPSAGRLLTSGTVPNRTDEITLSIPQFGSSAGSAYITVTSVDMLESTRTKVDYSAEAVTDAPDPDNITIANNAGKVDTISISDLNGGDIIKVYNAETGGKLLAAGTVPLTQTNIIVNISQLGSKSGSVYLTNTSIGKLQSGREQIDYAAEMKTDQLSSDNIIINNNVGTPDTIDISNVTSGDTVKVYNSASGGSLLGTMLVPLDKSEVLFNLKPLPVTTGSIYVTKTSNCKLESDRTQVTFSGKPKTTALTSDDVTISNYSGLNDSILVSNVDPDEVVKVYDSSIGGKLLVTGSVPALKTEITLNLKQLGTSSGSVYITLTKPQMVESDRVKVDYYAEEKSDDANANDITITNNAQKSGNVKVTNLNESDTVKVYNAEKGGIVLGTGVVLQSSAEVSISIRNLSLSSGSLYISVTSKGKQESDRVEADYGAVVKSISPDVNNITVTNNAGSADTIAVTGILSGDIIKVYNAANGGSVLGTATVPQFSDNTTITIPQLGSTSGVIYITTTSTNEIESDRTQVSYSAEQKSDPIDANNISIVNNAIIPDIINVAELQPGDIIKTYNASTAGSLLGTATVAADSTVATLSIRQLGANAGTVYISVTNLGKLESSRVFTSYSSETKSNSPLVDNVVTTNNYGSSDTVRVTNLTTGDVVKVYNSLTGGILLGSATASANNSATVTIGQLGSNSGNVYVTITSTGKTESDRLAASYSSEAISAVPDPSNITIVNNANKPGTITVSNLVGGDLITVYDASIGGNILGTGIVGTYDTSGTVNVSQLGSSAGSVYISITSKGKMESNRTKADFTSKPLSDAPDIENIAVLNNAGISDTVTVSNLNAQDIVHVYDSSTGGNLLGSATASAINMQATIPITQLGVGAGNVYVSIISSGKVESLRTKASYYAEAQTDAPSAGNITIANNVGMYDSVDVTGLIANDVVNVYSLGSGGILLGTSTVQPGKSEVIIPIEQIGTTAGSLYISVKSLGKTESTRTKADYTGESVAPAPANISIVNNVVISDTITVTGLNPNDLVKVYDSSQEGNLLGYASVPANSSQVTISVPQLTSNAGSVYVSTTSFGESESNRTKADYTAEQSSNPPYVGNVTVVNNAGSPDIITIKGLLPNDVINVYSTLTGDIILGSAMVASSETQAIINIAQLGTTGGSVYITETNLGKTESSRTKVDFQAEN